MLRIERNGTKTYEELMTEALAEIPLFSSEWTNYNVSDPGITILENLSAFSALQAAGIPNMPYEAGRRLFSLVGMRPNKGKCARVLMKADGLTEKLTLQSGTRFMLGGMVFETNRVNELGGRLEAAYAEDKDGTRNLSFITRQDVPVGVAVFGEKPEAGNAIYLVASDLPEAGRELILYVTIQERVKRNPVDDRVENIFASLRWECFTDTGFVEIKARDFTGCFLNSGEIRLRIPEGAAKYGGTETQGYCIRAILEKADYDMPPRVTQVESFLFEAWQRDTKAAALIFNRCDKFTVRHPLAGDEHILVFGKEEKGSSYRRYELSYDGTEPGRRCKYIPGEPDIKGRQHSFTIEFKGEEYRPDQKLKDPVRVVLYNSEVMRQYDIGQVMGYDGQELQLPFKRLVADSFSLIARRQDEDGVYYYDFVRPEKKEEGSLYYHLLENDGRIIIEEAGNYIGAELFIASIALTEGEKGNVRAMSRFRPEIPVRGVQWYTPAPGTGGAHRETLQEMGMRFRRDIDTPYTAVTAEDYERLALETPGLCLRKAHAVLDEAENLVQLAVLPAMEEERPVLSEVYRQAIVKRLEERRLLTTRINVVSPRYVEVHVRGTVYVRQYYSDPKTEIERTIERLLDDVHSDRNFGQPLRFRDVFTAIEALECVSFVYELTITPDDRQLAAYVDSDIYPEADVLCMAGEISIETVKV